MVLILLHALIKHLLLQGMNRTTTLVCNLYKTLGSYHVTAVSLGLMKQGFSVETIPSLATFLYQQVKVCLEYGLRYVANGNPLGDKVDLYDTAGNKFKCFKSVGARDVGWSVLSTDFR